MALTITTPIKRAHVEFAFGTLYRVAWATDETIEQTGSVAFYNGWPVLDSKTTLDTLQEMYAAGAGTFENAAGDDVIPDLIVDGPYLSGLTVADLESRGYINPLIAGSRERFINASKVRGAFMAESTVVKDATTGRSDIIMKGGQQPALRRPPTGELTQSLADWSAYYHNSTTIRMQLTARSGQTFSSTTIYDDSRARGMVKFLADAKYAGDDLFSGDIEDLTGHTEVNFIGGGRKFRFDQDVAAGTTENVEVDVPTVSYGPSTFTIHFREVSGTPNDLDVNKLNALFAVTSVILASAREEEEPPFGSHDVPTLGERFSLPGGSYSEVDGHPIFSRDGKRSVLGAIYGEVVGITDLPFVGSFYVLQKSFNAQTFVDSGSASRKFKIPDPNTVVPFQGEELEIRIHKEDAASLSIGQDIKIYNKNDEHLVSVPPGATQLLRLTWSGSGSRRIHTPNPIVRRLHIAGQNLGQFTGQNYVRIDGSNNARPMQPPVGTTQTTISQVPPDVITWPTSYTAYDNGTFLSTIQSNTFKGTFIANKTGTIRYILTVILRTSSPGNLASSQFLRMFKNGVFQGAGAGFPYMGTYDLRTLVLSGDIDVDAGDKLTPFFIYPSNSSIGSNFLSLPGYDLRADLTYLVDERYN